MSKKASQGQRELFDEVDGKIPWKMLDIAYTLSFKQEDIIRNIIRLYNDGDPFDADCTYSIGAMWKNLPEPNLKYDLSPQSDDVVEANAASLPLGDESIGSLMFDPPFKASKSTVQGLTEQRFTAVESVDALWELYRACMDEAYRVLRPKGIYVVKCMDVVSSGKNVWSRRVVENYGEEIGFTEVDLFILGRHSVMMSPNMRNQKHARKNHCFFVVFRK